MRQWRSRDGAGACRSDPRNCSAEPRISRGERESSLQEREICHSESHRCPSARQISFGAGEISPFGREISAPTGNDAEACANDASTSGKFPRGDARPAWAGACPDFRVGGAQLPRAFLSFEDASLEWAGPFEPSGHCSAHLAATASPGSARSVPGLRGNARLSCTLLNCH